MYRLILRILRKRARFFIFAIVFTVFLVFMHYELPNASKEQSVEEEEVVLEEAYTDGVKTQNFMLGNVAQKNFMTGATQKNFVGDFTQKHFMTDDTQVNFDNVTRIRREAVKKMMKHAWDSYRRYAWGKNELKPVRKEGASGGVLGNAPLGATIVDGLDTLYIMGFMDEFREGRDWIANHYSLDGVKTSLSVFETNIRFVGGFLSLYALTGDPIFKEKAEHTAKNLLPAFENHHGIPTTFIDLERKKGINGWTGRTNILAEFGTLSMEFNYLSDVTGNSVFHDKIRTIQQFLLNLEKPNGLYYSKLNPNTGKWFGGGMLALGAHTLQNSQSARHMEVAKGITNTCHESYDRTKTKLGPEHFHFTKELEAKADKINEKYYLLRPEVIESYFYLWRLTKDPKYREWGWEAAQAIQKYCWTPGGFSGIKNVYDTNSTREDLQQTFFLAETLKYLYLLFSDDGLLSLDEWVFNTEGHPLPIKITNLNYNPVSQQIYQNEQEVQ